MGPSVGCVVNHVDWTMEPLNARGLDWGVFLQKSAHQSMDPCHIKSIIRRAIFFYLCPQMHPRPYYVSHSNGAQCGMCGQPC